ncbi:metallophosphatase family protein [Paenibacillus odorifer]|uniref:metallophosphoesterase family protein n=1 Tax=Paenibacillus TaxID=44249 RepID=UPI00096BFA51|nr:MULTISPECIES: metallophosphoesterase family protein [Paenibacillus]MDH6426713.1 protein phosphatase [Paenibacillus sp. PastH-4]MDH6442738.1 protein phosphatase [Paenibacillus sp. PastF-4]MDH6526551.1 protein phosphatase [Paenibacillus sp. PastH-3]OMD57849.1 metallophosphatase family protein [Paenibacillus odorifer]
MEQIAIISDIHGNIPALTAVLDDIQQRGISRVFCLGDIVGKGPNSDLAIDIIKKNCEISVMGNWDDLMNQDVDFEMARWCRGLIGQERLAYLSTLPFSIEFMLSGKFVRLFHASPRSLYERVQPWDDYEKRLSLFDYSDLCQEKRQADIVGYGDIHNAFIQHLEGKTLFNVGSVGNPLDLTQASYVIMEGEYMGVSAAPLNMQFVRVPYDIELAVQQAVEADMPAAEPYIRELRTAQYRGSVRG